MIDVAIVGEPTLMQLAVAEKGLIVFDAEIKGTPGESLDGVWYLEIGDEDNQGAAGSGRRVHEGLRC